MRIDDYIKQKEEDSQKDYTDYPREIKFYDSIDSEKRELLESMYEHMEGSNFHTIMELYDDESKYIDDYGYMQTEDKNHTHRMLVPINMTTKESDKWCEWQVRLPRKTIEDTLDKYIPYGKQRYHIMYLDKRFGDETEYARIIYTEDGNIFLGKWDAAFIANTPIKTLADYLHLMLITGTSGRNYGHTKTLFKK